MGQIIQCR